MRVYFLIAVLFGLYSCHSTDEVAPDFGIDYFPLKVNAYQIYDVDETQYNQITGDVQSTYELKVTIVDSSANAEGGYTYILLRQTRPDTNSPWTNLDTWTARVSQRQGIVTEENTPYVKLVFPLAEGVEWNGNSLNTLGGEQSCGESNPESCDTYLLQDLDSPYTVSSQLFDHSVTVIQNDNPDLIVRQDVRKEVYAKDVGLIYKEAIVLNYCTLGGCLGQQIVETGIRYIQSIKEYGED